jgi:2-hydroxy fatty acid dioxygenase
MNGTITYPKTNTIGGSTSKLGSSSCYSMILPAVPVTFTTENAIWFYAAHFWHASVFYFCMKSILFSNDYSNIESALAFYGVYHRTPYNQLIHFFGVPLILWSLLIFAAHLPFTNHPISIIHQNILFPNHILPQSLQLPVQHRITWATVWMIMYTLFYLSMDITGACCYIPFLYIMYVTSIRWTEQDQYKQWIRSSNDRRKKVQNTTSSSTKSSTNLPHHQWLGTGRLLWKALLIHLFSWYIQIHPGHKILEGATPASLVNLGAALTAAPLFAFYEGIWYIGWRRGFQQRVLAQIAIYTQQLCSNGAKLRVCLSP